MSITFFLNPVKSVYPKDRIIKLNKRSHELLHDNNTPHKHEKGKYRVWIK